MNIYEALKTGGIRITNGNNRWMVWDEDSVAWCVYEKLPYTRTTTELFIGYSFDNAVAILLGGSK